MARTSTPAGGGESFQALLPSKPIQLPFEGSYAKIQVVYNLDRVMSLPSRRARLLRGQNDKVDALSDRQGERARAFNAAWDEYKLRRDGKAGDDAEPPTIEEDAAYVQAWREYTDVLSDEAEEIRLLNRESSLVLIGEVVAYLVWPFTDPAPDPSRPDSFAVFADTVLTWIASPEGGLKEAVAQMRSPLSGPK